MFSFKTEGNRQSGESFNNLSITNVRDTSLQLTYSASLVEDSITQEHNRPRPKAS